MLYKLTVCKLGMDGLELSTSMQTAVLCFILLIGLQAVRNIVAIPIQLSLDLPMSSTDAVSIWFTIPTYYQTQVRNILIHFFSADSKNCVHYTL